MHPTSAVPNGAPTGVIVLVGAGLVPALVRQPLHWWYTSRPVVGAGLVPALVRQPLHWWYTSRAGTRPAPTNAHSYSPAAPLTGLTSACQDTRTQLPLPPRGVRKVTDQLTHESEQRL